MSLALALISPGILLSADWLEALRSIEDLAGRAQFPYAIVGSLGMAVSLDLPWEPTKHSQRDDSIAARDLDLFLMGTHRARQHFREVLGSRPERAGPKIDVVSMYHALTEFGPSGPALRYRSVHVPVDRKLFAPVSISIGPVVIPVLHPRVHMHLILMQPGLSGKGTERVRSMARALARGLNPFFLDITEAECRAFHDFKVARQRRYPLRERILACRMVLANWEDIGRRSSLVALKAHLREHHPRLTTALRRLLD